LQVVNSNLERPVVFEYVTWEVDGKAGGTKRIAAMIVPDSRRRSAVWALCSRFHFGPPL
jgi:hypothetical protein